MATSNAELTRLANAFGLVLLLVFATFVAVSLISYDDWGAVAITLLGSLSAAVALATARATPFLVKWSARLAALSVLCAAAGAVAGGRWFFGVSGLILVVLLAVSAAAVLRAVVTENKVGFRTILGAVSVYLTLGLLFAFLYVSIGRIQNTPFFGAGVHLGRGDYPFFSMTTLTTTGYGDLVPAGQPGKMFAVLEMLMGQVFLVTLIARLVSLWEPGRWLRHGAGLAQDPGDEPGA